MYKISTTARLEFIWKNIIKLLIKSIKEERRPVKFNFSDMKNGQRRADYVSYQMLTVQKYTEKKILAPGFLRVREEVNKLLNDDMSLAANLDNMQFAMNAFLEDCDKNQELQYEYDEKNKIREATKHEQRLVEDEKELWRILERDADAKQIALEAMRGKVESCANKLEQLTLQYQEAKKQVDFECNIHAKNIRKGSEY